MTRLEELKRDRGFKLDTLLRGLTRAIEKGYPFASEHINLYGDVLKIEAGIRELEAIEELR